MITAEKVDRAVPCSMLDLRGFAAIILASPPKAFGADPPMTSVLEKLGIGQDNLFVFAGEWRGGGSAKIDKISPIDGQRLATVGTASERANARVISY